MHIEVVANANTKCVKSLLNYLETGDLGVNWVKSKDGGPKSC